MLPTFVQAADFSASRMQILTFAALPLHLTVSGVLFFLVFACLAAMLLYTLYFQNRLFFWSLVGALGGVIAFAGAFCLLGIIFQPHARGAHSYLAVVGGVLLFFVVIALAALALNTLYAQNRLFFWCLVGAVGGILLFVGVFCVMRFIFTPIHGAHGFLLVLNVMRWTVLYLIILSAIGMAFHTLYFNNRLLFWCLSVALGAHLFFTGILYGMGIAFKPRPHEMRIAVATVKMPPKVIPPPPKTLDLPLGALNGNRKAKKMPKGHRLDKPKSSHRPPGHVMTSGVGDDGTVPMNTNDKDLFTGHLDELETKDIADITSDNDVGTPEGTAGAMCRPGSRTGR